MLFVEVRDVKRCVKMLGVNLKRFLRCENDVESEKRELFVMFNYCLVVALL
jgi:hypothetical protein